HGERLDILAELPTLPTGEAFVWAPEFPEGKPIGLQRTSILLRETYDSASTPKVGEQRVEPKELADVDLERLRTKMAATIEKAKADDPRELRKQIADLRKQVGSKVDTTYREPKAVDKPVLTDADRKLLERFTQTWMKAGGELGARSSSYLAQLEQDAEKAVTGVLQRFHKHVRTDYESLRAQFEATLESKGFQKVLAKLATVGASDAD